MSITWSKLTKEQWTKACAAACVAGRTEVPPVLLAARVEKKK